MKYTKEKMILTSKEAARLIGMAPRTLANWRSANRNGKKAPNIPYQQIGRSIRYQRQAIEDWLNAQK